MKPLKDELQKSHGDKHQHCDFGRHEFNTHKRELPEHEKSTANKSAAEIANATLGGGDPPPSDDDMMVDSSIDPNTPGGNRVNKKWPCILLAFDGYTVHNTPWNFSGDIVCAPANLTSAQVTEILTNMRTKYAAYKVNVTTDLAVYLAADQYRRQRVVFTETWEWYGQAGGTSFINSFTWGSETPCFVFTSLLNYNTKQIKEAASHEVGHTVGLYHQCVYDANCNKTSEYNYGNGVDAPVMGCAYYVPDAGSKWWVGPNPYGCASIQNDNQILTAFFGLQ
jgi:hypothetical protein